MNTRLTTSLILLLLTAAACVRMEPTPRPTWSPPEEYLTAKQAYARILPAAQEWDEKFVVTNMAAAWHPLPEYRPRLDGTAPTWDFELTSPTKWTWFSYSSAGSIRDVGCWDDAPAHMCEHTEPLSAEKLAQKSIPMDAIIDSDEAVSLVRQSLPGTAQLRAIGVSRFVSPSQATQRISWRFSFQASDDSRQLVYVDMVTGEITYNDFAVATPTSTLNITP